MPISPSPAAPSPNLFGRRALAYLLDLALLYAFTLGTSIACVFTYAALHYPGDAQALADLAASTQASHFTKAAHVLYYFSYFTIAHWYFGRTCGKWALGLTLRRQNGETLSLARSLGRSLLYVVSGQLTVGVGFLFPLWRKDGRTLHDLIATTEVVDAKPQAEPFSQAA